MNRVLLVSYQVVEFSEMNISSMGSPGVNLDGFGVTGLRKGPFSNFFSNLFEKRVLCVRFFFYDRRLSRAPVLGGRVISAAAFLEIAILDRALFSGSLFVTSHVRSSSTVYIQTPIVSSGYLYPRVRARL